MEAFVIHVTITFDNETYRYDVRDGLWYVRFFDPKQDKWEWRTMHEKRIPKEVKAKRIV